MRATKRFLAVVLTLTTVGLLLPSPARGAATASDNACSAGYSSTDGSWTNVNGGTGFTIWINRIITGGGSFLRGDSGVNGGSTNINTSCSGGYSWGVLAGGGNGNTASVVRVFTAGSTLTNALQVGQTFQIDFDCNYVDNSNTVGFALQNSSGQNVFDFTYRAGQQFQTNGLAVNGATNANCGITYKAGNGLRLIFTLTATNTCQLQALNPSNSATIATFPSIGLQSPVGGQAIDRVKLFSWGIGSGNNWNAYFNSMSISCPTFTATTPSAQSVCAGATATFATTTSAAATPTYQWKRGGVAVSNGGTISGATTATITLTGVATGDNGTTWSCDVVDTCGTTNNSGSASLTILNPAITTTALPNVSIGVAYNQTVTATGGTPPYTWSISAGSLPAGLTIDAYSGVISGTYVGSAGTSTFTVRATGSGGGCYDEKEFVVQELSCSAITLSPSSLPNGTVAVAYGSQTITASGGTGPYTYAISSGNLPAGLMMSSAGVISGTPTAGGPATFTVLATDSAGCSGTRQYAVTPACGTITLSPADPLASGTVGTAYSVTITAGGGTSPYTYNKSSGTLPAGLTLSSAGVLSGTPTGSGTYTFDVTATDQYSCAGTATYHVTITCGTITLSPASLPYGVTNAGYNSQTITASGGAGPYTFAVTGGSMPVGLTLSSAGVISGTPTAPGNYTYFDVTATDNASCTGTKTYNIATKNRIFAVTPYAAAAPFTLDTGTTNCAVSGGSTANSGNTITVPASLPNPAPAAVYQHQRYGNITYAFSNLTAGATYDVRLHFAETYWSAVGSRVFNVFTNGRLCLSDYDIIAQAGGQNIAVITNETVAANSSGQIVITFSTVTDNAQINGVEILQPVVCLLIRAL